MSDITTLVVAGVVAFVTGTGGTAIVNWMLNRSGRKAEAAKQINAASAAREAESKRGRDRAEMLAAAQAAAQKTWLESSEQAYKQVDDRCNKCLRELQVLREEATSELESMRQRARRRDNTIHTLIDAVTEILPFLDGDSEATKTLRATVRAARDSQYE